MTSADLGYFKAWFEIFLEGFQSSDEEDQKNISLKVEHSHHVSENTAAIARDLDMQEGDDLLARSIGLFHDIGRFPQYRKYRTFRDAVSINHGRLGAETLVEQGVLDGIAEEEKSLILQTVRFHSAMSIPSRIDERGQFFLKLIRDADKLDVFRVFVEFYESPEHERPTATAHGVPDRPGYSRDMLDHIIKKKIAPYSRVRNLNDFKLMQLSWVYDLHFPGTFRILRDRDLIGRIALQLPQSSEMEVTLANIMVHIDARSRA